MRILNDSFIMTEAHASYILAGMILRTPMAWLPVIAEYTEDQGTGLMHRLISHSVGSVWICDNLYPYMNDSHIPKAMQRIAARWVAEVRAAQVA